MEYPGEFSSCVAGGPYNGDIYHMLSLFVTAYIIKLFSGSKSAEKMLCIAEINAWKTGILLERLSGRIFYVPYSGGRG